MGVQGHGSREPCRWTWHPRQNESLCQRQVPVMAWPLAGVTKPLASAREAVGNGPGTMTSPWCCGSCRPRSPSAAGEPPPACLDQPAAAPGDLRAARVGVSDALTQTRGDSSAWQREDEASAPWAPGWSCSGLCLCRIQIQVLRCCSDGWVFLGLVWFFFVCFF